MCFGAQVGSLQIEIWFYFRTFGLSVFPTFGYMTIKEHDIISSDTLPVMEDFYTIQGEGFYQGHAAYFVRLGGCDVGCVWCDVKESWDASLHPLLPVNEIVRRVQTGKGKIVVITGGEPAMYNLDKLTAALQDSGFRTHIETSGVYPLTGVEGHRLSQKRSGMGRRICGPGEAFLSIVPSARVVERKRDATAHH
jgi:hypothetical protein